jgi:integrase/recombinase XerD
VDRGHRTLVVTRKGGKVVTIRSRRAPPALSENRPVVLSSLRPADGAWTGMVPADCPQSGAPGGDHQDGDASYAAACVHYRQFDAGVPLRNVQEAASHADPRTTMRYDRARGSLDRHATYIVAAYVAGAAR